MVFSTAAFAIFMAVVFLVYWNVPQKYRVIVLLFANAYFYLSYDIKYITVILVTMVVSYFCGRFIEKSEKGKKKKIILAGGVVATLSLLLIFKYLNFALYTVAKVFSVVGLPMEEKTLALIMPIGISFYTFQMVGYITDIYRGKISAEKSFIRYAVFVSFFPNISSGPIERAGHFIPQIDKEKVFDYKEVVYGARLILWGLVKKIVIADMMLKYVDEIFNKVPEHTGICFAWATLLYTFEIYCDFSGYSDMAVGVAKMLGFELFTNFKSPYFASSIKEFWSRWHISLSQWFRDYVYIPLGGNRCKKSRRDFNLIVTFLASGLWHGASWTFVLWGGIHGVCQVIENRIKELFSSKNNKSKEEASSKSVRDTLVHVLLTVLTFIIVSYAWMFFRANSISEAIYIVKNMFTDLSLSNAMMQMTMSYKSVIKTAVAIVLLMVFDYFNQKRDLLRDMDKIWAPVRYLIYLSLSILVVAFNIHNGTAQEFIYFKF